MLDPQKLQPNKQQLLPRWYCDVPFLVAQGFHDVFLKAALLWRSRSIYQILNSWIMIFLEILLLSRVSIETCQKQQKLSKIQWLHEITIYLIYPRSCLRRPMLPWRRRSFQRTSATILESRATSTFIVRLSKPCSLVLELSNVGTSHDGVTCCFCLLSDKHEDICKVKKMWRYLCDLCPHYA